VVEKLLRLRSEILLGITFLQSFPKKFLTFYKLKHLLWGYSCHGWVSPIEYSARLSLGGILR
jgi:hypothetical protein